MAQAALIEKFSIFKAKINMDKITPAWHYQRGWIREKQHRFLEAVKDYQLAISADDSHADWHFRLGHVREKLKQFPLAVEAYLAALARDETKSACRLRLAHVYELQGKLKQAAATYEDALARDPRLTLEDTNLAEIRQVLRLWRFTETTYATDAADRSLPPPAGGEIKRTVLSNKSGRKVARTVSRVELPVPWAGRHATVIEKIYRWPKNRPLFLDLFSHAELLFYICHPRTTFKTFVIPELVGLFTTSDGVVLLISDQRDEGESGFRATKFLFEEEAVAPLLRAISEFNLSNPLGGHEQLFDPSSAQLHTDRGIDRDLPWQAIGRIAGIKGKAFMAGVNRFLHFEEQVVARLNRNGMAISHQDIAPGNLLTDASGKVAFIDFENVRVAPPGFDIGDLLVFLIRSNIAADRLPDARTIIAFHKRMVELYVAAARELGHTLSTQSVHASSIYAFVLYMLKPPKQIRITIMPESANVKSRKTIIDLLAYFMANLETRLDDATPKAD